MKEKAKYPIIQTKDNITLVWDGENEFKPTNDYISHIAHLMIAEINMMREVHKDTKECWVVGSCKILDLSDSRHFQFTYGEEADEEWIKECGDIFVKVPL